MKSSFRPWGLVVLPLLLAGCGGTGTHVFVPPLSEVILSVSADTVAVGSQAQYSATALDLSSQPVSGVPFTWTSTNPAVVSVTGAGRVRGEGEGIAYLIVEYGGVRDSAQILVLPATGGWVAQTSNSSRQLNDVKFRPNGRQGCVVGGTGEVLLTFDAGVTWERWLSGTSFNLNAVWFITDSLGWAVGGNGTALKTTTGGRTWTLVTTGSSDNLMDVQFADANHGWVVGSSGVVLTTANGGASWLKQYPTANTLNGVAFSGTMDGWAVGNGGVILGSHDGGTTWFVVSPSITAQNLMSTWRRSSTLTLAVGSAGVAPRTIVTPDSTAWELRNTGAANDLRGVMFVSDLHGWAVGDNGGGIVLESPDGGVTWNPQTAPAGTILNGVYFVDDLRGWAVGDNGRILHTGNGGN